MGTTCAKALWWDSALCEDSVSVAGAERVKAVGRTLQALKELCLYLKSQVDTRGRMGEGQEEIQLHSVSCGTQRYARKRVFRTSCSHLTHSPRVFI